MPQATQAAFDAQVELDEESLSEAGSSLTAAQGDIRLSIYEDLAAIEREWRTFEQTADGTVFQSFDWLSTWQHHIGSCNGVMPAIVTGRDSHGQLLFLLPLAVERSGSARRLTWLGAELCDYNGPLLAPDFGRRIDPARFKQLWREIMTRLQSHPNLRFDVVTLTKMQETVGAEPNPFIGLGVMLHASGAYLTRLSGDWETFYTNKRSSTTRRRDRSKRKRLGEFGEVRFVVPAEPGELAATLDTLMEQKSGAFDAMGVADIFAVPGHREFYHALAAKHDLTHISRLDVGTQTAAVNLGVIHGGSYYHLLASYDGGELSKFGPGAAHMHDLLRTAIERGCSVFDFTIGDERYKQEWCDRRIALFDHVSAATPRGIPAALRFAVAGRLKRFIKQTPALWDAACKFRVFIAPLKKRLRG